MNRTKTNDIAARKFKSLLVALLIASQLVTTVYALPVPQPNHTTPPPNGDPNDKDEHESAAQRAYKLNQCARDPAKCAEDAALKKVDHIDQALHHGIEKTFGGINQFEHRIHDKVQSADTFKDALLYGKDPSEKDGSNMAKRDYMPTVIDLLPHLSNENHLGCSSATACDQPSSPPYRVVLLPVSGQYEYDAPRLVDASSDLLGPSSHEDEAEGDLQKRHLGHYAKLAAATVGVVGGTAYLGSLAKDKIIGDKRSDDDKHHRDHYRYDDRQKRSVEQESSETDDQLLKRSPTPMGTGKAVLIAGGIGLTAASFAGGAYTVVKGVKDGIKYSVDGVKDAVGHDDDRKHHHSKRSGAEDAEVNQQLLFKRAPLPRHDEHQPLRRSLEVPTEPVTLDRRAPNDPMVWKPTKGGKMVAKGLMYTGLTAAGIAGVGQVYHYFKGGEKDHEHRKRSLEPAPPAYVDVMSAPSAAKRSIQDDHGTQRLFKRAPLPVVVQDLSFEKRSPVVTIEEAPANAVPDLKSTDFHQPSGARKDFTLPGHPVTPPKPYVPYSQAVVPYKAPAHPPPAAKKGLSTKTKVAGAALGLAALAGTGTMIYKAVSGHKKDDGHKGAPAAKRSLDGSEVTQRLFKRAPIPMMVERVLIEKRQAPEKGPDVHGPAGDKGFVLKDHTVTPPASYTPHSQAIVPYKPPQHPTPATGTPAKKGMSTKTKVAGAALGIAALAGTGTMIYHAVKGSKKKDEHSAPAAKRALDESEVKQRLFNRAPLPLSYNDLSGVPYHKSQEESGMDKRGLGSFVMGAGVGAGGFALYKQAKDDHRRLDELEQDHHSRRTSTPVIIVEDEALLLEKRDETVKAPKKGMSKTGKFALGGAAALGAYALYKHVSGKKAPAADAQVPANVEAPLVKRAPSNYLEVPGAIIEGHKLLFKTVLHIHKRSEEDTSLAKRAPDPPLNSVTGAIVPYGGKPAGALPHPTKPVASAKRKGMSKKGKAGLAIAGVATAGLIAEGASKLFRREEDLEDDALVKRFAHQSMVHLPPCTGECLVRETEEADYTKKNPPVMPSVTHPLKFLKDRKESLKKWDEKHADQPIQEMFEAQEDGLLMKRFATVAHSSHHCGDECWHDTWRPTVDVKHPWKAFDRHHDERRQEPEADDEVLVKRFATVAHSSHSGYYVPLPICTGECLDILTESRKKRQENPRPIPDLRHPFRYLQENEQFVEKGKEQHDDEQMQDLVEEEPLVKRLVALVPHSSHDSSPPPPLPPCKGECLQKSMEMRKYRQENARPELDLEHPFKYFKGEGHFAKKDKERHDDESYGTQETLSDPSALSRKEDLTIQLIKRGFFDKFHARHSLASDHKSTYASMQNRYTQQQETRETKVQTPDEIRNLVYLRAQEARKAQQYYGPAQRQDRLKWFQNLQGKKVPAEVTSRKEANWEDPIVTHFQSQQNQDKGKAVVIDERPEHPSYATPGASSSGTKRY